MTSKNKVYNFIQSTSNCFGLENLLLFKSKKKFYTKTGLLVSTIVICIAIITSFYFSREIIFRESPQIQIHSNSNNLNPKLLKITTEENFFVSILDYNFAPLNASNLFDIYILQYFNGAVKKQLKKIFKMEKCNDLIFEKFKNVENTKTIFENKENLYCLPSNFSAEISGHYSTGNDSYIEIIVKICNVKENINCIPENQRSFNMMAGLAYFGFMDYDINFNSYDKYKIPILRTIPIAFNRALIQHVIADFQTTEIETDSGFFFLNSKKTEIVNLEKFDQNTATTNFQGNDILMSIFMKYSTQKNIIKREYKRVQDVLGQIGGILNILVFIGNVIITPFAELTFYLKILRKNFCVAESKIFQTILYEKKIVEKELMPKPLKNVEIESIPQKETNQNIEFIENNVKMNNNINNNELINSTKHKKQYKKNKNLIKKKLDLNAKDYFKYLLGFRNSKKLKIINEGINFIKKLLDINNLIYLYFENQKINYSMEKEKFNNFDEKDLRNKPKLFFKKYNTKNIHIIDGELFILVD